MTINGIAYNTKGVYFDLNPPVKSISA